MTAVSSRTDNATAQAKHRRGVKTELAEIRRDQRSICHQLQDLRAALDEALAARQAVNTLSRMQDNAD